MKDLSITSLRMDYINYVLKHNLLNQELINLLELQKNTSPEVFTKKHNNVSPEDIIKSLVNDSDKQKILMDLTYELDPQDFKKQGGPLIYNVKQATYRDLKEIWDNSKDISSFYKSLEEAPFEVPEEVLQEFETFVKENVDLYQEFFKGIKDVSQNNVERAKEISKLQSEEVISYAVQETSTELDVPQDLK